jgi:hypothetical protein
MPEYFSSLNKEFRYQLTVIGTFAQAIIKEEITNNQFVIQTNEASVKVSWQVTGIKKDPFAEANRVVPLVDKEAENKGICLDPKAYGEVLKNKKTENLILTSNKKSSIELGLF